MLIIQAEVVTRIEQPFFSYSGIWNKGGEKTRHGVTVDLSLCQITAQRRSVQESQAGMMIRAPKGRLFIPLVRTTASGAGLKAKTDGQNPCILTMTGSASDPIYPGAPSLDYTFANSFTVIQTDWGCLFKFHLKAEHDPYPSYEYWLQGQKIYDYNHLTDWTSPQTPSDLFWWNWNVTGEVWGVGSENNVTKTQSKANRPEK